MKKITAGRKGLITVVLMIILSLVFFYILKQPIDSSYQKIIYAVYATGILWSLLDYKRAATSATKFKDYFSEGFKTFIMVTFIMVIYTLILYLCNPQIEEAKLALNSQMITQLGDHTPIEIAENTAKLKSIFIPMTLATYTFIYLGIGALITAVLSSYLIDKLLFCLIVSAFITILFFHYNGPFYITIGALIITIVLAAKVQTKKN